MKKRKQYQPEFKTKTVLEVLREESTQNEIASRYEISSAILSRWTNEFLERAPAVFKRGPSAAEK
jgi:putative transposase